MLTDHERLLRLLEEASASTPRCFVLLYSYFAEVGLGAENEITARGGHPSCLEPHPLSAEPDSMIALCERLAGKVEFEVRALQWLKGLDRMLNEELGESCAAPLVFQAVDARGYRLCRRNDIIADHYGEATWEADQSSSLAAYARFHKLVPIEPIEGRRVECFSPRDWGYLSLHDRLRSVVLHQPSALRVMIWPFRLGIRYQNVEEPDSTDEIRLVKLCEVGNEAELVQEIEEALAAAREKEATVLLFPELVVPETAERRIRDVLRSHGGDAWPILTLFGCTHRPSGDGRQYVNEAILLGPDGRELHRHRKLSRYTADRQFAERIEVGSVLSILESALGNLVPLICLDLPHVGVRRLLEQTHGNFLLVPSLSRTTSAHATIARQLQASNRAATFVSNRRYDGSPSNEKPEGTSFYRVPRRKDPEETHFGEGRSPCPYLLFELEPA